MNPRSCLLIAVLLFPSASFSSDSDGYPVNVKSLAPAPKKVKIDHSTPQKLIDSAIAEVMAILNDDTLAGAEMATERRERIRKILLKAFDMKTISGLTLSKYYKKFTKEQLKEFSDVFSHLLFNTYIGHIEGYSGEEIAYKPEKEQPKGRVEIQSEVALKDAPISVDYRFLSNKGVWKVYDIKVEGVSLVSNYRSQFRDILIKRSPDELIDQLKKKVAKNEEE